MKAEKELLSYLRGELGNSGDVDDVLFDAIYPDEIRAKSARFWTPVAVASRAARLLASHGARRVLDVGSGAGKFCLIAACVCPDLDFTGIEQRPHLVEVARRASVNMGLDNVHFLRGDVTGVSWSEFDGLYFYNPFAENLFDGDDCLDETVELSYPRFLADVQRAVIALDTAAMGTCMVTYHGFGGPIPASYQLVNHERAGTDRLRLWVRCRPDAQPGTFHVNEHAD